MTASFSVRRHWPLLLLVMIPWGLNMLFPLPLPKDNAARIVVAEDGTPLWRFADSRGIWRYPVTLDEVSPAYIQALLTFEDRWFWQHPGINPVALVRAAWQDIVQGKIISGGSTLTMQVARLIDPRPRTFTGKLIQIWRAVQLEWRLTKRDILTLYLNHAPFGGTVEGIGAASWMWLGKAPSQLTRGEAALLAALPQSPSRLRPDRWPQRAQAARDKVLDRLAAYHVWSASQVAEIRQEPVWLPPPRMPQMAPLLARRLAAASAQARIVSTINPTLQRDLEDIALNLKHQLPPRTSLAMLVVDHTTMKVRGYVGSVDINDPNRFGHVDMIKSVRSPGSLLKPFIYAMALDEGLIHSQSLLQDVPRRFSDYRPGNFDANFSGPVSASEALVRSLNLPAVQLLEVLGPKKVASRLRNAGVNLRFPVAGEPNLSLALGGTGIRMDEILTGYSAFVRQGNAASLRWLSDQPLRQRQLFSPGAAWIIRRILAGQQPLANGRVSGVVPLALKTGTSYGYRDAWAVGMNPQYLIGIWVGRPDVSPVAGQFGVASAVPVLNQVNSLLMALLPVNGVPADPRPSSVSVETICWPGGQSLPLGDDNCRQRKSAWLLNQIQPPTLWSHGQESQLGLRLRYWRNGSGLRVAADCPGAVADEKLFWPLPLEPWLPLKERREARLPAADVSCPPLDREGLLPLIITGAIEGQLLQPLPGSHTLSFQVSSQGGQGAQRWWFLNGTMLERQSYSGPVTLTLVHPGSYQIVVMDEAGQLASVNISWPE